MLKSIFACLAIGAFANISEPYGERPDTVLSQRKAGEPKYYNILSIDGGGIRGIIPVQVIDYLETETYKYALEKGYI